MLCVCLPHQLESSFYHTNTEPDTSCNFSQTEPSPLVDAWRVMKCWPNVSLPRTQRRIAQFRNRGEIRRFCSCKLGLLSTELHRCYSWDISVKCLFQEHNSAICPRGHQTSNHMITILRCNRLS